MLFSFFKIHINIISLYSIRANFKEIYYILNHIFKTKIVLKFIDNVLDKFKDDPYIDVIKLHYFEDKTYNQIAEIFDHKFGKKDKLTAPATIGSNNQRLVRELQKYLFPNDYLYQLLGY